MEINQKPKRDRTTLILILGVAMSIVVIILGHLLVTEPIDDSPRIGDVWEFYGTGDPFDKKSTYKREIIDIKGEYVKFIENDKDTLSRYMPVFIYNSERIKVGKIEKENQK